MVGGFEGTPAGTPPVWGPQNRDTQMAMEICRLGTLHKNWAPKEYVARTPPWYARLDCQFFVSGQGHFLERDARVGSITERVHFHWELLQDSGDTSAKDLSQGSFGVLQPLVGVHLGMGQVTSGSALGQMPTGPWTWILNLYYPHPETADCCGDHLKCIWARTREWVRQRGSNQH